MWQAGFEYINTLCFALYCFQLNYLQKERRKFQSRQRKKKKILNELDTLARENIINND